MYVKKTKSRLISTSKNYIKEWKTLPHINAPHKANTLLTDSSDNETDIETGPIFDDTSMSQAKENTILTCAVDTPPLHSSLSQSITPSK